MGDSAARGRPGRHRTAARLISGSRAQNTLAAAPRVQVVGNASDIFGVDTASTLASAATSFDKCEAIVMMIKCVLTASLATIPLSWQQRAAAETGAMTAASAAAAALWSHLQHGGGLNPFSPAVAHTPASLKT